MYNYSAKIIFKLQSHVAESCAMDPESKFWEGLHYAMRRKIQFLAGL